jgi:hypothetical protein
MASTPQIVATLVTNQALYDFRIFVKTLTLWNPIPPTIYLFADKEVIDALPSLNYKGTIHSKEALTQYTGLTRATMERRLGKHGASLFFDFTLEKIDLIEWAFGQGAPNVFFFDADICFLAPLPEPPPEPYKVALSQHQIRDGDEARFGKYNAGFMWFGAPETCTAWREACKTSRFFEQAALECFDGAEWSSALYQFPIQHNYGWWRLWQGKRNARELKETWSVHRIHGITVEGKQLCSIHTHWQDTGDIAINEFNKYVLDYLKKLSAYLPAMKKLVHILRPSS